MSDLQQLPYLPADPEGFITAVWAAVPESALAGVIYIAGDQRQIRIEPADPHIAALTLCPGQVLHLSEPADPHTWRVIDAPAPRPGVGASR